MTTRETRLQKRKRVEETTVHQFHQAQTKNLSNPLFILLMSNIAFGPHWHACMNVCKDWRTAIIAAFINLFPLRLAKSFNSLSLSPWNAACFEQSFKLIGCTPNSASLATLTERLKLQYCISIKLTITGGLRPTLYNPIRRTVLMAASMLCAFIPVESLVVFDNQLRNPVLSANDVKLYFQTDNGPILRKIRIIFRRMDIDCYIVDVPDAIEHSGWKETCMSFLRRADSVVLELRALDEQIHKSPSTIHSNAEYALECISEEFDDEDGVYTEWNTTNRSVWHSKPIELRIVALRKK